MPLGSPPMPSTEEEEEEEEGAIPRPACGLQGGEPSALPAVQKTFWILGCPVRGWARALWWSADRSWAMRQGMGVGRGGLGELVSFTALGNPGQNQTCVSAVLSGKPAARTGSRWRGSPHPAAAHKGL